MMILKIKPHLRETLYIIKPLCDVLIANPTPEAIAKFLAVLSIVNQDNIQELQQYVVFPFLSHMKPENTVRNSEILINLTNALTTALQKIHVTNLEIFVKAELALISMVFDRAKTAMISNAPEELKFSVIKCLTELMMRTPNDLKIQLLKKNMPVLAQSVFVSVHIAKLEKMRALRLASIECMSLHTITHPVYTDKYMQIKDPKLEEAAAHFVATILPGVVRGLQDVALCRDNPGHAIVKAAIEATHRVLSMAMHNKHMDIKTDLSVEDFTAMIAKSNPNKSDTDKKDIKATKAGPGSLYARGQKLQALSTRCNGDIDKFGVDAPLRSREWYRRAGEKLLPVTRNLAVHVSHDHHLVRRELAMHCARLLDECCETLPESVPLALDVLITLSNDSYTEVSQYCSNAIKRFFRKTSPLGKIIALEGMCENFIVTLTNLPKILNNIDSSRKLSALNLVRGYVDALGDGALCAAGACERLCDALLAAAALQPPPAALARHVPRGIHTPQEIASAQASHCPWLQLRHLDTVECQRALEGIIQQLGASECSEMLLDRLLEMFLQQRDCELVYIMNCLGSAPGAPSSLAKRIINTYIEEDIWNLPLEVDNDETPLTTEETLDPVVYNPRAWFKDTVPGLYEGTFEVRYTDISYRHARADPPRAPAACPSAARLQHNVAAACLLAEGVGQLAKRLKAEYQPFLLKTLCLILDRVGSKYEAVHWAGSKALADVAAACEVRDAAELIAANADYCTSQIAVRLKKAWNVQSAVQILTVVMTYSDPSVIDYLYATVEDVLVQSCDKYHQRDLSAYLQVFECFVYCIQHWFPVAPPEVVPEARPKHALAYLKEFTLYVRNNQLVDKLLNNKKLSKRAKQMYADEQKEKEEKEEKADEAVDSEEPLTQEPPPLPKHVCITVAILKRTINFVTTKDRDDSVLAMHVLQLGFPMLKEHENELLPLVHKTWAPLVTRFVPQEPLVMKKAFELLVTLAEVSKDFICSRAAKDVLPAVFQFLSGAARASLLQDAGAAYRRTGSYLLQVCALDRLHALLAALAPPDRTLRAALLAVRPYLSRKQPKQLQALAVTFHKEMLSYNYGLTWLHLRDVCDNDELLAPPTSRCMALVAVRGTPYASTNRDYDANVRLIFDLPFQ